jgi:hypothetical protein
LHVKPVIVRFAFARIMRLNARLGPELSVRPVISSLPDAVAVIQTSWLAAPASIVTRKSMYPVPLIVFDADTFVERPEAPPKLNDAVTESAFADVTGFDMLTCI